MILFLASSSPNVHAASHQALPSALRYVARTGFRCGAPLARSLASPDYHWHGADDTDTSTGLSSSVPSCLFCLASRNNPQVIEASLSFLLAHSNLHLDKSGCEGGGAEGASGLTCGNNSRSGMKTGQGADGRVGQGVVRAPSSMSGLGARPSGLARPGKMPPAASLILRAQRLMWLQM